MDRRRQRRTGNRNPRTQKSTTTKTTSTRTGVRRRLVNRRNRRVGQGVNRRNRLERAQGALRNRNNRRFGRRGRGFSLRRRNLRLRKVFVGGLPRSITNRQFYNLFRDEGRLLYWRVAYDRNGYSRGWGDLEYENPRAAWRAIRKWDGSSYQGLILRVEYKKRQRRRNNNRGGFGNGRGGYGYNRGGYNRGYGNRYRRGYY